MATPRSSPHGGLRDRQCMHARAGRLALDAQMANERAARLLDSLPEGQFLLNFLREIAEDDWVLEDKFDPVRAERKKG